MIERRAPGVTGIECSAQFLAVEPGVYSVRIAELKSAVGDNGLRLPCVRIEAATPGPASPGRAYVGILTEAGWLAHPDEWGFIRVTGGRAGLVVTTYRRPGVPTGPEIHISLLGRQEASDDTSILPSTPIVIKPPSDEISTGLALTLLIHAATMGDMVGGGDMWVGGKEGLTIEAFCLRDIDGVSDEDVEYQAILGRNWNTPWMAGGEICGSRGIAMPILGVRIRLLRAAAAKFTIVYAGRFSGGSETDPLRNGEACFEGGLSLEALRVMVMPIVGKS